MSDHSGKLAYHMGREIVRLHDECGLPHEISLPMAEEQGKHIALLGIMLEAALRHWPKGRTAELIVEWKRLFTPTELEQSALRQAGFED